jgi:farnesyl diphosphate synthase
MSVSFLSNSQLSSEFFPTLQSKLKENFALIDSYIRAAFSDGCNRVEEAMLYSILNGGKRLRGSLVIETARLFNVPATISIKAAVSLEALHSYSLIHDDLPDMDDSDLRRGLPSCHIKFDNATAILAGDALLTWAFEILSSPEWQVNPNIKLSLISSLATFSGKHGMIAGQMLDMQEEQSGSATLDSVKNLQHLKTGQLFMYACQAGCLLGNATKQETESLQTYAKNLGLVFQIADDLLDIDGNSSATGKPVHQDTKKTTFVDLMGENQAIVYANELINQGLESLEEFGDKAIFLQEALKFSLNRRY